MRETALKLLLVELRWRPAFERGVGVAVPTAGKQIGVAVVAPIGRQHAQGADAASRGHEVADIAARVRQARKERIPARGAGADDLLEPNVAESLDLWIVRRRLVEPVHHDDV